MKGLGLLGLFCVGLLSGLGDQSVFDFCVKNKKTFIAIVWPIADGKHDKIVDLLNLHGHVVHATEIVLEPQIAYVILKKSHYNCPKIKDFKEHLRWYYPKKSLFQKPARVFVCTFDNTHQATQCKYAVRKLFNVSYRAIHINDTHDETIELAQILFR